MDKWNPNVLVISDTGYVMAKVVVDAFCKITEIRLKLKLRWSVIAMR